MAIAGIHTGAELARRIGTSQQNVSNLLDETRPEGLEAYTRLRRICEELAVSSDELLGLPPKPGCPPVGHWLIDLDLVEKIQAGTEPPDKLWSAQVPKSCRVLTHAEYSRFRSQVRKRDDVARRGWGWLRRKRKPSPDKGSPGDGR